MPVHMYMFVHPPCMICGVMLGVTPTLAVAATFLWPRKEFTGPAVSDPSAAECVSPRGCHVAAGACSIYSWQLLSLSQLSAVPTAESFLAVYGDRVRLGQREPPSKRQDCKALACARARDTCRALLDTLKPGESHLRVEARLAALIAQSSSQQQGMMAILPLWLSLPRDWNDDEVSRGGQ